MDFPGSSSVARAEYDPERGELRVTFAKGATYVYMVDQSVADGLFGAASPGQYVRNVLAGLGGRRV